MLKVFILLFTTITFGQCYLERFINVTKSPETLLRFLHTLSKNLDKDHITFTLRNTIGHKCRDVVDRIMFDLFKTPLIIWNGDTRWELKTIKSQGSYVFINALDELNDTLYDMRRNRFIYSNNGMFLFLTCTIVNDYVAIKDSLELIWSYGILNYSFLFYLNQLQIYEYDPFTKNLINTTDCVNVYCDVKDKLSNVHRYELKVYVNDDFPSNYLLNETYYGRDAKLLKGFFEYINASVRYYVPSANNVSHYLLKNDAINRGIVDFYGIGGPMEYQQSWNIVFTYPYKRDDVVLMVPVYEKEFFYSLLRIFDNHTWMGIIFSFVSIALSMNLLKSNNFHRIFQNFYDTYRLACTKTITTFTNEPNRVRIIVIIWIYSCMIIDCAIQSAIIRTTLDTDKTYHMINLDQAAESNVRILIALRHMVLYPEDGPLYNQMQVVLKNFIYERLLDYDKSYVYALQKSYAYDLTKVFAKNRDNNEFFVMADDELIPSLYTYAFPIGSPYLKKINSYILRSAEHGLELHFMPEENDTVTDVFPELIQLKPFNMIDMYFAFVTLIGGHILAASLFLMEFFYYCYRYYKDKTENFRFVKSYDS